MRPKPCRAAVLALLGLVLAACGDDAPPALRVNGHPRAAWEKMLASRYANERADALEALAQFEDPPIETIVAHLDDQRMPARLAAMRALGACGEAAAAYADRLAAYLEKDPEGVDAKEAKQLRDTAMGALGQLGPTGFKSFAHLLVSKEAKLRARAAFTMRPLAAALEDGVGVLLPLASDDSWVVRREAVKGLGVAGKGDERAAVALVKALEDEHEQVVQQAAMALGGIGGRSDREGAALARLLRSHQTGLRAAAVYALGQMGIEASPYESRIADLIRNDSKQVVRIQAALAHWRIRGDPEVVLPALERGIACEDKGLCRDALKAVAEVGAPARALVPHLLPLLEDPALRVQAAAALGAIGPAAGKALPALEAALAGESEQDAAYRREAAQAIESIRAP